MREEQTRQDRRAEDAALDALGGRQPELKLGLDRLKLQIQREENRQRLLTDGHIFYLEGWVPEADTARLEQRWRATPVRGTCGSPPRRSIRRCR